VDGGIALLPCKKSDVDNLRTRLGRVAGVDLTFAITTSAPADVPAAAGLVRDLLDVIRIHRHPPNVYELDDLVLEFQLSRPSPARDRLAELLEPLTNRADLLTTLRCYLANARSRRQTAADLHVHANTVDYRLKQVARLTGLDPVSDDQLPRIVAALVAFDAHRSPV
jgi:sugar diacid utilization regulator